MSRLATLNLAFLSDTRHVKASDAEKQSIREDILKTRERLLNVRSTFSLYFDSSILNAYPFISPIV